MGCTRPRLRICLLGCTVALSYLATILIIVGLTTNYWKEIKKRGKYSEDTEVSVGLHRVCWISSDRCNNQNGSYDEHDILPKVRGLLITAGFVAVIASCLSLLNLYFDRLGRSAPILSATTAIFCCIAGVFTLIAVILFAVRVKIESEYISIGRTTYEGYSFGLSTLAGIFLIIATVVSGLTSFSHAEQVFNMN